MIENESPDKSENELPFLETIHRDIESVIAQAAKVTAIVDALKRDLGLHINNIGHPTVDQTIDAYRKYLRTKLSWLEERVRAYTIFSSFIEDSLNEINKARLFVDLIGLHHIEPLSTASDDVSTST